MKQERLDRWFGFLLVLIALGWSWAALATIPAAESASEAGPRLFPLLLGVLLGLFGLIVMVNGLARSRSAARRQAPAKDAAREGWIDAVSRREAWVVATTFGLFMLYAFLLDKTGFLVATPVVVLLALKGCLGLKGWVSPVVMAAGLTAGCYLIFAVLLSAPLPRGAWIDIL